MTNIHIMEKRKKELVLDILEYGSLTMIIVGWIWLIISIILVHLK